MSTFRLASRELCVINYVAPDHRTYHYRTVEAITPASDARQVFHGEPRPATVA